MKRVALQRKKPMSRGKLRATVVRVCEEVRAIVRIPAGSQRGVIRAVSSTPARSCQKEDALQHGGYQALVRRLPCARCGWPPPSQFCHADAGKGQGLKTDCRRGYPGCGPRIVGGVHEPGCHWVVGTSGRMKKADRRAFEEQAGADTRDTIFRAGTWPARLPLWNEGEVTA